MNAAARKLADPARRGMIEHIVQVLTIVAILGAPGVWVANTLWAAWANHEARLNDHEKRISIIEANARRRDQQIIEIVSKLDAVNEKIGAASGKLDVIGTDLSLLRKELHR